MFYGRLFPRLLCGAFLLLAVSPSVPAQTPAAPVKAAPVAQKSKNVKPVTIVSVDDTTVKATMPDGSTTEAEVRPTSLFLMNGVSVAPTEFKAGAKALLRTRTKASDGTVSVVMLCDAATQAAIDAYRKKVIVGTLQSVDEKEIVVKPDAGTTPLTLRVSDKTVYKKGDADSNAAAFGKGAAVAVVTRGLPSGLLMASIVSDKAAGAAAAKAALRVLVLSGAAADVTPDKNLLTVIPKGKPRQTISIGPGTNVKVRKADAALKDVTNGMRVTARMGKEKDADGHLIATSLSAFDAAPAKGKPATPAKKP